MNQINRNSCLTLDKLKESANTNLRNVNRKPIFDTIASIQESILCQAIQNHAKMGCLFCSSIVDKGEIKMFYTFESKIKFSTQEIKK